MGDTAFDFSDDDEEVVVDPLTLGPDLYYLCQENETGKALELLEIGVPHAYLPSSEDPTIDTSGEWSCLSWAAYNGNIPLTIELLKRGASKTYAEARSRLKLKEELLATSRSQSKATPASVAAAAKLTEPLLINTPLIWAAKMGYLRVCWLLLIDGYSSIDDVDSVGNTALHLAAANGHSHVVGCLIADGADVKRRNNYRNTAFEVCKSAQDCKAALRAAIDKPVLEPLTREQRKDIHLSHVKKLEETEGEITNIADTSKLDIDEFEEKINSGIAFGISEDVAKIGTSLVRGMKLERQLKKDIADLQGQLPVITQSAYTNYVNTLKASLKEVEALFTPEESSASLTEMVKLGEAMCETAHSEFWLQVSCQAVEKVVCATEHTVKLMTRLKESIVKAEMAKGNEELVKNATALHNRLSTELEMRRACDGYPVYKLPDSEMDAKAAKEYWGEEDVGKIEETREWPLPPEETGQYIWVPSESLKGLRDASERLENALKDADAHGCNVALVEESRATMKAKGGDLVSLEGKNDEDRDSAVAVAEKLAKKLKKGGKKKK